MKNHTINAAERSLVCGTPKKFKYFFKKGISFVLPLRKASRMRKIDRLFSEYGESHQDETNKLIHWICVPAIFFSLVAFMYGIKLGSATGLFQLNLGVLLLVLAMLYYAGLSGTIWVGMLFFSAGCLFICHILEKAGVFPLWQIAAVIFILAWIGQFYGHKIEGKKPSFLKDLEFLLVGPAWLMGFIYRKLSIPY